MSDSSIPVSSEFREELEDRKNDGESYEAFLRRKLGSDGSDGSDESDSWDGLTESDLREIEAIVDERMDENLRSHRQELYSNLR